MNLFILVIVFLNSLFFPTLFKEAHGDATCYGSTICGEPITDATGISVKSLFDEGNAPPDNGIVAGPGYYTGRCYASEGVVPGQLTAIDPSAAYLYVGRGAMPDSLVIMQVPKPDQVPLDYFDGGANVSLYDVGDALEDMNGQPVTVTNNSWLYQFAYYGDDSPSENAYELRQNGNILVVQRDFAPESNPPINTLEYCYFFKKINW